MGKNINATLVFMSSNQKSTHFVCSEKAHFSQLKGTMGQILFIISNDVIIVCFYKVQDYIRARYWQFFIGFLVGGMNVLMVFAGISIAKDDLSSAQSHRMN